MNNNRLSELTIIVGKKGSGKTTFTINNIIERSNKKVLIVDTYGAHPAYSKYSQIPAAKAEIYLKNWQSGKLLIAHPEPLELFPMFEKNIYNSLVILEDAKKYITDSVSKDLKRFIIDHKNKGLDIVLMFHSLSQVPAFLRQMYENIIIFKTKDTPADIKKLYSTSDVLTAWQNVNSNPDKFYCEWIHE